MPWAGNPHTRPWRAEGGGGGLWSYTTARNRPLADRHGHAQAAPTLLPGYPVTEAALVRPSLSLFGLEGLRAGFELLSHQMSACLQATEPRPAPGDGHPVLIFPGLGADGASVGPLREHCRRLGYAAFDWGRGCNTGVQGDPDAWLRCLAAEVRALLAPHEQPATLVGWSLGGIYARELTRLLPGRVRQVITIGTPFNADDDHSNAGWPLRLMGCCGPAPDRRWVARLRRPLPVPSTSIYSRSDGVVAWQTCRHPRRSARTEDVEVEGSHLGMAWNPQVLQALGERLARPGGA